MSDDRYRRLLCWSCGGKGRNDHRQCWRCAGAGVIDVGVLEQSELALLWAIARCNVESCEIYFFAVITKPGVSMMMRSLERRGFVTLDHAGCVWLNINAAEPTTDAVDAALMTIQHRAAEALKELNDREASISQQISKILIDADCGAASIDVSGSTLTCSFASSETADHAAQIFYDAGFGEVEVNAHEWGETWFLSAIWTGLHDDGMLTARGDAHDDIN